MPDFSKRSNEKELLDDLATPFEDIRQNMQELNTINSRLGGHSITLKGLRALLGNKKEISVCEIGCGGGDNLVAIGKWCHEAGIKARLSGIDMNPHCIRFALKQHAQSGIEFICSDYREVVFSHPPDIIFSSLLCHHFTNDELVLMLQWMQRQCTRGFFINDLHRHPLAWWSIKWLTRFFSNSYLVKNDAPLSVLRGFSRMEWQLLFQKAGMSADVSWQWAFRHLIIYRK